jgi:hypothetical protein
MPAIVAWLAICQGNLSPYGEGLMDDGDRYEAGKRTHD